MIKKSFLLSAVMFLMPAIANEAQNFPYVPQSSFVNVEYEQKETDLINFDKMNKKDKVEKAANQLEEKSKEKMKLDTQQIIHQKALDYTTRQNTSIPIL